MTSKGAIGTRRVAYVEVRQGELCGVGEAAPLPGWSESWSNCIGDLREASASGKPPQGGAARFAWDCAHADLRAQRAGWSLQRELGAQSEVRSLPVNGTIGVADDQDVLDQAQVLIGAGFRVLKLKVGALSPERDLERILALRATYPKVHLRLDANAAWDVTTAVDLLKRLRMEVKERRLPTIDYIEQPVPVGDERLFRERWAKERIGFRIAADESCVPYDRALGLIRLRVFDVLVIKPMVVGSLERLRNMVAIADENKVRWIFTSSVDSAIARATVGHLAVALGCKEACGLATGSWLERDVATLSVANGRLELPFEGPGLGFGDEDRTLVLR